MAKTQLLDGEGANLLEQASTQWQTGDWQGLAQLNPDTLQHHPDRAKLTLLAAAGRLQIGLNGEAKEYIRLAEDWGIRKDLISQILISCVHSSIGRAALIAKQKRMALQHFKNAVPSGISESLKEHIAHIRIHNEIEALRFLSDNYVQLRKNESMLYSDRATVVQEVQPKATASIRIEESGLAAQAKKIPLEDFVNEQFDIKEKTETTHVLVIFSTPRSGSTLLCDVLRNNDVCLAHEYFQPYQYLPMLAKRWECVKNGEILVDGYVDALRRYRTLPNGWLGINLHGSHIPVFMKFQKEFRNLKFQYIHIIRQDILGQAISFNIANQTGLWSSFFRPLNDRLNPEFDFQDIESTRQDIERQNQLIRSFISTQRIDCQNIFYEDLISNWKESSRILSSIFNKSNSFLFDTNLKKQESALTNEWRSLYNNELINLSKKKSIGLLEFHE